MHFFPSLLFLSPTHVSHFFSGWLPRAVHFEDADRLADEQWLIPESKFRIHQRVAEPQRSVRSGGGRCCALWTGTGGSGLLIRRHAVVPLIDVLLQTALATQEEVELHMGGVVPPADIVMQQCLRGGYRRCGQVCRPESEWRTRWRWIGRSDGHNSDYVDSFEEEGGGGGMCVTPRMLTRHIGFASSLSHGYRAEDQKWRCGWRQVFNGQPDVLVVEP